MKSTLKSFVKVLVELAWIESYAYPPELSQMWGPGGRPCEGLACRLGPGLSRGADSVAWLIFPLDLRGPVAAIARLGPPEGDLRLTIEPSL